MPPAATAADRRVAPLAGALPPQCQRDLDSLRAFVRRAVGDGRPAPAVPATEVREVLLTGATGFVGRFMLRELLCLDSDLVVHCLVRAADAEHGLQRLRAAMQEAGIWDEALAARIRVVAGDIGEAHLGLGQTAFDDLARRIDAVHHFAAEVSLSTSYSAIRHDQRGQHAQRAGAVPAHPPSSTCSTPPPWGCSRSTSAISPKSSPGTASSITDSRTWPR